MNKPDTVATDQEIVACDGNGIDPGHPKVFLHMTDEGHVDCPYCGRRFTHKDAA